MTQQQRGASRAAHGTGTITVIHIGDLHGHLTPRANLRRDAPGRQVGGLARLFARIRAIRARDPAALLVNTGDTIQGSAEVLYTRGQAIVDVLDHFGIDAFAPGNWDFVYGTERFLELFSAGGRAAGWSPLAANLYFSAEHPDYAARAGQHVLPPYRIVAIGGITVGILGLTTDRGPQAIGPSATRGFRFLKNGAELDAEVAACVAQLRHVERVDVLVLASEMGLANNIRIARAIPGIDVVLSSDMHEVSVEPVIVTAPDGRETILVEEGQDGTQLGELRLTVEAGRVVAREWQCHAILDDIPEDEFIAQRVRDARAAFVQGPAFTPQQNPFNGAILARPIDTVVGATAVPLHRSNFAHDDMPAVIEGSSHDFLADAFRVMGGADIGAIRGFRYGTHVPVGPIRLEDLFHFIPIGPQIAVATISGQALKKQIETSADGTFSADLTAWTGGWLFGYSGVTIGLDPYAATGVRATAVTVNGAPLRHDATYTYASYWYADDPCAVNRMPIDGCECVGGAPANVRVLRADDGAPLDATEVVARYLERLPNRTATVPLHRVTLVRPLPPYQYGFPEIQPLCGARPRR